MADEDTVLEEAMDKESRKLRWAAHQGDTEPLRSQGMTDCENYRDLLTASLQRSP